MSSLKPPDDEKGSSPGPTSDGSGQDRAVWRGYVYLCRLNERLEWGLALLAGALLGLFTLLVAIDVIYRQVLVQPMMWPSEWSIMVFVWSVMLGAAASASRQSHFVVVLVADRGRSFDHVLRVVVAVFSVLFALVILYFGWLMTLGGTRRFTPMMGYSMVYVFAAFPAAGLTMLLFTTEQLIGALGRYPLRHNPETEIKAP